MTATLTRSALTSFAEMRHHGYEVETRKPHTDSDAKPHYRATCTCGDFETNWSTDANAVRVLATTHWRKVHRHELPDLAAAGTLSNVPLT
jgi:hypothetical protein